MLELGDCQKEEHTHKTEAWKCETEDIKALIQEQKQIPRQSWAYYKGDLNNQIIRISDVEELMSTKISVVEESMSNKSELEENVATINDST